MALQSLPILEGIELDLLRRGDHATLDGRRGILRLPDVREINVVTAFLENDAGRILLLRRSSKVRTFRGWWAAVSGTMEGTGVLAEARREISEELGVAPSELESPAIGKHLLVRNAARIFRIHPCRFRVHDPHVVLNWEHTRSTWIRPGEIAQFRVVPKLAEAYRTTREKAAPRGLRQKE
ncbi:MAG: NUDIX domain-containing protein [Thermoplasmata archaeon]|nr:NUDIX domain-containing protein [Thermoplasmata archaeon]